VRTRCLAHFGREKGDNHRRRGDEGRGLCRCVIVSCLYSEDCSNGHTEPSSSAVAVEVVDLRMFVSLPSSNRLRVSKCTYIHDEVWRCQLTLVICFEVCREICEVKGKEEVLRRELQGQQRKTARERKVVPGGSWR
jgi:hypothetical protein